MSTPPRVRPRAWSTVNFPMAGFFWFVGGLWLALFAVDLTITAGIAVWGEVETSVWEQVSEIVRFFTLFMMGWLVHTYLPTYVAHGVTRREFMQKLTVFAVAFCTLLAALVALGFLLERLVYELAAWPQDLSEEQVFGSATELPTIFVVQWLAFLIWAAIGALGGAAIYRRDDGWALVALPACIALMIPAGSALGSSDLPLLGIVTEDRADSLLLAVALCLPAAVAGLGLAWALIREIPIRSKTA